MDSVRDIAWFDTENNCYHIQTCIGDNGDNNDKAKHFLRPSTHDTFKWYVDFSKIKIKTIQIQKTQFSFVEPHKGFKSIPIFE